ncbi:MAG: thioredoxin [Anaerolineales bacterium]|jgi:thioredoxin 1
MSNIIEVDELNFENEVVNSKKPVLVDFGAVWCGPCKMLDPIIHDLSDHWVDKVKVVKLDIDQNPSIPMQYGIMGVPTLMLFKNGEPQERLVGYMPKERILEKLNPHLSSE